MTQALIAKIKALRDVAEKANPKGWEVRFRSAEALDITTISVHGFSSLTCLGDEFASGPSRTQGPTRDAAEHIASHNPAAMIALYDEMLKVLEHKEDGK
jgi:hypothetical protein